MSDFGTGGGRDSVCWSAPLQCRPGCHQRGAVGKWIVVPAGGVAMRCVPGKICAQDSGDRICGAHRVVRTGGDRSYAIHARGPLAESAGTPALRPGCGPGLQTEANRNLRARYEAQIGLERPGPIKVKRLKTLHGYNGRMAKPFNQSRVRILFFARIVLS